MKQRSLSDNVGTHCSGDTADAPRPVPVTIEAKSGVQLIPLGRGRVWVLTGAIVRQAEAMRIAQVLIAPEAGAPDQAAP